MPPLSLGFGLGLARHDLPPYWEIDFTRQPAGYSTSPPSGLVYSRASCTDSVQTGTSTLVVCPTTADVLRFGRALDAWDVGLVHEVQRSNYVAFSSDFSQQGVGRWIDSPSSVSITRTAGQSDPAGGTSATRVQITASAFQLGEYSASTQPGDTSVTASLWIRDGAPNVNLYRASSGRIGSTANASASWQRVVISGSLGAETTALVPADARDWSAIGGLTAGTRDAVIWGAQREGGPYPTEQIPTLAGGGTRYGGLLRLLDALWGPYVSDGRLRLELRFRPKGARVELEGTPYLFHTFDNASAWFSPATGVLTLRDTAGATNTCTLPSFARHALTDLWIAVGGGATTVVRYRLDSGITVALSVTGSALGSMRVGARDLYMMNANGGAQLSCWLYRARGWRPGLTPAWAA